MRTTILISLLAASLATGQQGDRSWHGVLDSVVPVEKIPPAPVLPIEEALKAFQIAQGFVIEPVAFEPLVEKPVALTFDEQGRIWVVEMRGFMPDLDGNGENLKQGRIVILEDADNDGKADKRTVFADGLDLPRAVALVKDGVLIADNTSLYYCGRDGVKRTSDLTVVDPNYAPGGNVEHRSNGMMRHLNNWFYNTKSDQRYRWRNGKLEKDRSEYRGQWGISMDDFGRIFHTNNSVLVNGDRLLPDVLDASPKAKFKPETSVVLGSNKVFPIRMNPGVNRGYLARKNGYDEDRLDPKSFKLKLATGVAGLAVYRGGLFADSYRGAVFSCESTANLVKAVTVEANGLELKGRHVFKDREFLASTDERFRPVNIYTAPDGCLYLVDMYHGLIQHKTFMTSYLRDQYASRGLDKPGGGLGRIYRIRPKGTKRGPQPRLLLATTEELVGHLSHPNGWWRDTAQRLLVERNDAASRPLLRVVLNGDSSKLARVHALWTLAGMSALGAVDIEGLLGDDQPAEIRIHALVSGLDLPVEQRVAVASSAAGLIGVGKETNPYALRFLASLPIERVNALGPSLSEVNDEPFAIEAVTSGLLAQGVDEFPETGTKLDAYLAASAGNLGALPVADRLSSRELASFNRGKALYNGIAACVGCHGADGAGLPNLGPPLDSSEWVTGNPERLAKIMLHGLQGPITVDGVKYEPLALMPGLAANPAMNDTVIADLMNYIRSEWSNTADSVNPGVARKVRKETKDRNGRVYTVSELMKSK